MIIKKYRQILDKSVINIIQIVINYFCNRLRFTLLQGRIN